MALFKKNIFLYGHHDSEAPHDMFRHLTGKIWSKMGLPEVAGTIYKPESPMAGSMLNPTIFLFSEPRLRHRSEFFGQGSDKFHSSFTDVQVNSNQYQHPEQIGNFFSDEVIFEGDVVVPAKIIMGSDVRAYSGPSSKIPKEGALNYIDYGYPVAVPSKVWEDKTTALYDDLGKKSIALPVAKVAGSVNDLSANILWADETEGGYDFGSYGPDGTVVFSNEHMLHISIPEEFVVTTNLDIAEAKNLPIESGWDNLNIDIGTFLTHPSMSLAPRRDYNTDIATPFDADEPWIKDYDGPLAIATAIPSYNFHMPDYESTIAGDDVKETSLPNQFDIYGSFLQDDIDEMEPEPGTILVRPEAKRYMDFVNLYGRLKPSTIATLQHKVVESNMGQGPVEKELVGPTRAYFSNWARCYPSLSDSEKAKLDDIRNNIFIQEVDLGPAQDRSYQREIFDSSLDGAKQLYPMSVEVRFSDFHTVLQQKADAGAYRHITNALYREGLLSLLMKWSAGVLDGSVENAFFPAHQQDEYSDYQLVNNISFVNQQDDMAKTIDGAVKFNKNVVTEPQGTERKVRRLSYRSWIEGLFKIADQEGTPLALNPDLIGIEDVGWYNFWAEYSEPIENWSEGTKSIAWGNTIASGYYAIPDTFKGLTYGGWPTPSTDKLLPGVKAVGTMPPPRGSKLKEASQRLVAEYYDLIKSANLNHARTYQDILNGVLAYNEILFYRIEKFKHNQDGSKSLVQNIFKQVRAPGRKDVGFTDFHNIFIDTQVKYGEKYSYEIYAICFVLGNKYRFTSYESQPVDHDKSPHKEPDNRYVYRTETELDPVIIEIPYYKSKIVSVLDKPPMPPGYDIVPYKDKSDTVLINFESGFGSDVAVPIPIAEEEDYSDFPTVDEAGGIEFATDDMVSSFRVYRLDTPPTSYADFANGSIFETAGNATSFKDNIQANKTYYYTFKSVDGHGHLSNPTVVMSVELVNQDGMIYPIIEEYQMSPLMYKALKKDCQKYIHIKPAPDQATMSEQSINKMKAFLSGDTDLEGNLQDFSFPGIKEHSLIGREFKVRIKSKKSGKIVDINLSFEHEFSKPEEVVSSECVGDWPKFDQWLQDMEAALNINQQEAESQPTLGEGPTPAEPTTMGSPETPVVTDPTDQEGLGMPGGVVGGGNY